MRIERRQRHGCFKKTLRKRTWVIPDLLDTINVCCKVGCIASTAIETKPAPNPRPVVGAEADTDSGAARGETVGVRSLSINTVGCENYGSRINKRSTAYAQPGGRLIGPRCNLSDSGHVHQIVESPGRR